MSKYFGTDGIRARFGSDTMNEEFAYRTGRAIGQYLEKKGHVSPCVLIGRDTRPSGKILLHACSMGLLESKASPINCGILPSPALAFEVLRRKASFGIMITASHNPHHDNGIKCFSEKAEKLSVIEESIIESLIDQANDSPTDSPSLAASNQLDSYMEAIIRSFKPDFLKGLVIALDLANGATATTTPRVLEHLGAKTISMHLGEGLINDHCGSEHLESLRDCVVENKADLGIAHDGDGDRIRFLDRAGLTIDGDQILGLLALHAHQTNTLQNSSFVATIHSNSGLAKSLEKNGVGVEISDVGDRNVFAKMQELGLNWGGESSGHVIASDYLPTGDGLFAALKVLEASFKREKDLGALADEIHLWPSRSLSFKVSRKVPIEEVPSLKMALSQENGRLGNDGRVLLRYSGTESKIRLMVEGKSVNLVDSVFENIGNEIKIAL